MKKNGLKLIMLSAMYENGGNTTHRLLDGHKELFVYPFESQLGTKYVNDYLTSLYPVKYRWPVIPSGETPENIYELIIDEEGKVRSKTSHVSKFRHIEFDLKDSERKNYFVKYLKNNERADVVSSYFKATFSAWKNYKKSGQEKYYVGYSPIVGVDADKIINDFNGSSYVIHVIRNPFSAYADTKKRPMPLSLAHYMTGWVTCQYFASIYQAKYPKNFFIIRFEDLIQNQKKAFQESFSVLKIKLSDTLTYPSFNGEKLTEVYPWGTIKIPTPDVNLKTAKELSKGEIKEIYQRTKNIIGEFGYESIYKNLIK